jgi:hypothetical protein
VQTVATASNNTDTSPTDNLEASQMLSTCQDGLISISGTDTRSLNRRSNAATNNRWDAPASLRMQQPWRRYPIQVALVDYRYRTRYCNMHGNSSFQPLRRRAPALRLSSMKSPVRESSAGGNLVISEIFLVSFWMGAAAVLIDELTAICTQFRQPGSTQQSETQLMRLVS